MNHGNHLYLRVGGQASNSMPGPSSPMQISRRGQASTPALESSPLVDLKGEDVLQVPHWDLPLSQELQEEVEAGYQNLPLQLVLRV